MQKNNVVDQWEALKQHNEINMANKARTTRNNRHEESSKSTTAAQVIDGNEEAAAPANNQQVSIQMGTNILGPWKASRPERA
jgi:hypothetical protein